MSIELRTRGASTHAPNVVAVLASLAVLTATRLASGETTAAPPVRTAVAEPSRFLPGAVAPDAGSALAAGMGWAGWDGATKDVLLGAYAEGRLGSRLVIGVGALYAPATQLHEGAVRPSVVARLQLLRQERHGIDAGVALGYRQDRFVAEEGFIHVGLAAGWRSDRGMLLANLGYGQDGEGDDFESEARLAGFRRMWGGLHLGLDGHARKLLGSNDPMLAAHGTPSLEYGLAPAAAFTSGSWIVIAEVGLGGVRTQRIENGVVALGGVGAVF